MKKSLLVIAGEDSGNRRPANAAGMAVFVLEKKEI
jgi:hypothetical protein